jgi:hypothetical protein
VESHDTLQCKKKIILKNLPKKELNKEIESIVRLNEECDLYILSKVKNDEEEQEVKESLKFFDENVFLSFLLKF